MYTPTPEEMIQFQICYYRERISEAKNVFEWFFLQRRLTFLLLELDCKEILATAEKPFCDN